ncbi:MAG: hypothetical protein QOH00_1931 [Gaiellales bacterium]|jgi:hypothetical protein|nr:hypothetical protein [Gaiellales bacterium]
MPRLVAIAATTLTLGAVAILAAPASGGFENHIDPVNCHYTTHHVFHLGNGKTTEVRVTYTSQRFTSCETARTVAHSFASTAGCHDTRYCHVAHGNYSCHSRYYANSNPIAHCKALHEQSGEVFVNWRRIDTR